MDIEIASLSLVSIISICIMIGTIIFFYIKKRSMVYAIVFANFIVFFISLFFTSQVIGELAFRPIYLSIEQFPQLYTLFTSMFLHSTTIPYFHIIFNMFMFILIAPTFENRIGAKKFLAIYILTGICAAITHALIAPLIPMGSSDPYIGLIGASGAISGILGAYAYAYPKDRVYFPIYILVRIPVLFAGIIFLILQTLYTFGGGDSNVAYLAHIGGFLSGIVIAAILIRRKDEFSQPLGKRSYDYFVDEKLKKIDFSNLKKLATTPELKEIFNKIEKETIPQARDIWLDHFIEKARCPVCNNPLKTSGRRISCEKCDFKTKY